jgi:Protein of unknown function (DUF5818)
VTLAAGTAGCLLCLAGRSTYSNHALPGGGTGTNSIATGPRTITTARQRSSDGCRKLVQRGRITKANNGKLRLEDPSTLTSFALDNQKLAKKYAGKNVVVTGTLDEANNILHVRKIELAT